MDSKIPTWIGGVLGIMLVTIFTRGIWFGDPIADYDEQLYSFVGWRMTQGYIPFVDLWDRKPFGLFAIFAIAHAVGGPGPLAYQITACLFSFAGSFFVYMMARDQVGRFGAYISATLYPLILSAYYSYAGQSEVFYVPLMTAMAWLIIDTNHHKSFLRAFIAMALGGIALQIKYTVLPQCLFFGLYALWGFWRNGMKKANVAITAICFSAIGLIPTIIVSLYYLKINHFEDFIFANFISFFERLPSDAGRFYEAQIAPLALLVLTIVGSIYAAIKINHPNNIPQYRFYIGWLISAQIGILIPSTVYIYYYAAMAPVVSLLITSLLDQGGRFNARYAILAVICWTIATNPLVRLRETQANRKSVALLVKAISPYVGRKNNCLYVFDGPTSLYRLTDSCVPTRFVYPDHLNNALEAKALGVDQSAEVARIMATRPGAVVTAKNPVTPQNPISQLNLKKVLSVQYTATAVTSYYTRKITVWIRTDLLTPNTYTPKGEEKQARP